MEYPPEQNIIEVCDHWLRSHTNKRPSWKEVANALKRIHLQELASAIETVYETGIITLWLNPACKRNEFAGI